MKKIILLLAVFITACGPSAKQGVVLPHSCRTATAYIDPFPIPPRKWSWLRRIKWRAESKSAWSAPRWKEKM